ncbi:hypothetical protein [Streptomyces dubilierae]|uniref:Uncharacterized protein n=1 Tax=Streptomyces dubilierae TaxID=3075533 RepID=A0ABU2P2P4_9ACTN|nr:hypothetical protein [Streptomyces sp. DSM 41921]MDT0386161.1 hypothetical protein [Streptomyces sp. DSM 41921]
MDFAAGDVEGKGAWIPEGWGVPIFLIAIACVAAIVAFLRWRGIK